MDIHSLKKELRKRIRNLKNSISMEERKELSHIIQNKILQLEEVAKAKTILLYHSLPDEVDTSLLLESLSNRMEGEKRVVLPVVSGEILLLKEYVPDKMNLGYQSIMEPEGEVILPEKIDLAIVPGVAFDADCNRMGRGKGFYDKLLPSLKCCKIGLGFGFQIVGNIPCEPFDQPLDMVVTDNKVYKSPLRLV